MHPSLLPRRIASVMTDSKKTPYVPIENRPLLGVDEVEALTGVPAKNHPGQRAQRPSQGVHGGQHDDAHPPRRPGRLARRAARLARIRKPHLRPIVDEVGFFRTP